MFKRITLAAVLLSAGITAAHAAEPLFHNNGGSQKMSAASASAAGSPFAGDRKVRSARGGLHMNPAAAAASELSLPLPDGSQFNAKRFTSYATNSGATVWVGKHSTAPVGSPQSAAEETVLVLKNGKVTGTMRHQGKLYQIRTAPDGSHGVAEIDDSQFPPDHGEAEYKLQVMQSAAPMRAPSLISPMLAETPVIRVLVNYTAAAKASTSNIAGLIDLAIAETNQGYVNAGVNARVELAHAAQVTYTESGNNGTDRSRYASVSDRVMDEIHTQRSTHAADIGVLLTEGNTDGCGIATIFAQPSTAFAVVVASCATGNYSFGHELGHLYGARHNPQADPTSTPYAYGHGYQAPSNSWRTVMAYPCTTSCPRLNWWSNPSVLRDGVPMGTTTVSNNARVLNERAAALAGFVGSPIVNGVSVTNTTDYAIPDNNTIGVSSPVSVATAGNAGTVTLDVSIIHPYIGDLVVDLIAPDNTVYNLHNRTGAGTANIQRSFSVSVGAKSRVGTWKLRAVDRAAQDIGRIDSWTFKSQ